MPNIQDKAVRQHEQSAAEFRRAERVIPGGLVSRIRWRDHQVVFTRGSGAYLWDVDGNRYIDCVMAHGPVLLGHACAPVNAAAKASIDEASQFGGSYVREAELAEAVLSQLDYADKVTFMTTGTEAVQLAIRIARTATGRDLIVKFDGHYHGWIDPVYVNVPGYDVSASIVPDPTAHAIPVVAAVEGATVPDDVVVAPWGDLAGFASLMDEIGATVAAIIMEPFITGFGTFIPEPGYLQGLKDICARHGALMIFDEIVTGFRVGPAGASGLTGVTPDLGTYAKALANGFPISMVAGTDAAMACVADGRVPSAGTYSGTPASIAAALASLATIRAEGPAFYDYLDGIGRQLKDGFERVGRLRGVPIIVNQIGSLAQVLCGEIAEPHTMAGAYSSDRAFVTRICEEMIANGVYTTRKGLFFLSRAHTHEDIAEVVRVFDAALQAVLAQGAAV